MPRPKWLLYIQVLVLRFLTKIGMFLHKLPSPRPPPPTFSRVVPSTTSPHKGSIGVHFYMPRDWRYRRDVRGRKFPVLVNFHGGGFTIGTGTDDARWAHAVVEQVGAIVASVDYRLAPEYAVPTAVEDGADAVMYIVRNAEELHVDVDRIGVSGFSAGGNLAFTVPLMLQSETHAAVASGRAGGGKQANSVLRSGEASSSTASLRSTQDFKIAAIISWYPAVDYTLTREERVATMTRKDKQLSSVLTRMFDESYLQPATLDLSSPFLSPGLAPQDMLENLPDEIIIYACEWDMLRAETETMRDRLEGLGKQVKYSCIASAAQ